VGYKNGKDRQVWDNENDLGLDGGGWAKWTCKSATIQLGYLLAVLFQIWYRPNSSNHTSIHSHIYHLHIILHRSLLFIHISLCPSRTAQMSSVPALNRSVLGLLCQREVPTQNKDCSNPMGKVEERVIFHAWHLALGRI
jgi:hypothetical protein